MIESEKNKKIGFILLLIFILFFLGPLIYSLIKSIFDESRNIVFIYEIFILNLFFIASFLFLILGHKWILYVLRVQFLVVGFILVFIFFINDIQQYLKNNKNIDYRIIKDFISFDNLYSIFLVIFGFFLLFSKKIIYFINYQKKIKIDNYKLKNLNESNKKRILKKLLYLSILISVIIIIIVVFYILLINYNNR